MHEEHGAPHVPQQSFAPVILGAGVFFINLAFALGLPFAIVGLLIFAIGIAVWVREDMESWRRGSDAHE